jgi:hypothetical protein
MLTQILATILYAFIMTCMYPVLRIEMMLAGIGPGSRLFFWLCLLVAGQWFIWRTS